MSLEKLHWLYAAVIAYKNVSCKTLMYQDVQRVLFVPHILHRTLCRAGPFYVYKLTLDPVHIRQYGCTCVNFCKPLDFGVILLLLLWSTLFLGPRIIASVGHLFLSFRRD